MIKIKTVTYTGINVNTKDSALNLYKGEKDIKSDNPSGTILAVFVVNAGNSGYTPHTFETKIQEDIVHLTSTASTSTCYFTVIWVYK